MQTINVEFSSLFKRLALRFIRTFVSGGLAALAVQFATIPTLNTFSDLKIWIIVLSIGFISGGVSALEKWSRE